MVGLAARNSWASLCIQSDLKARWFGRSGASSAVDSFTLNFVDRRVFLQFLIIGWGGRKLFWDTMPSMIKLFFFQKVIKQLIELRAVSVCRSENKSYWKSEKVWLWTLKQVWEGGDAVNAKNLSPSWGSCSNSFQKVSQIPLLIYRFYAYFIWIAKTSLGVSAVLLPMYE